MIKISNLKSQMSNVKGFTLVELLVVMGVLAVVGTMILMIFTNSLRGSNKTQIVGIIKQNGQAVLDTMDKAIRDADSVVCPPGNSPADTLVIIKNGSYTRFKFFSAGINTNGYLAQDFPVQPATGDKAQIKFFLVNVCTDPLGTDTIPAGTYQTLTDTNPQTGISVGDLTFTKNPNTGGFKDSITIKFKVAPGIQAPQSVAGQIDAVNFETTVQLR